MIHIVESFISRKVRDHKLQTKESIGAYRASLEALARSMPRRLEDMTEDDLLNHMVERRTQGRKATSWNRDLSAFREFFRFLVVEGIREDNPTAKFENLPVPPRKERSPLPIDDLMTLLKPTERRVAEFLRETGLTPSAAERMKPWRPGQSFVVIRASARQPERRIDLRPKARRALEELGGELPYGKRAAQRHFQKAGFTAKDLIRDKPASDDALGDLHPRVEGTARQRFRHGDSELSAFAAMREVEIRVRQLAEAPDTALGVDLMKQAFGKQWRLTDPTAPTAEQEAMMALFWGAIGVFKNPTSYRHVGFESDAFVRDVILLADLLHRLLDEVEHRKRS